MLKTARKYNSQILQELFNEITPDDLERTGILMEIDVMIEDLTRLKNRINNLHRNLTAPCEHDWHNMGTSKKHCMKCHTEETIS